MGCYLDIYVKQILFHKEFNKIGPSPHKFYSFYMIETRYFCHFQTAFRFPKKKNKLSNSDWTNKRYVSSTNRLSLISKVTHCYSYFLHPWQRVDSNQFLQKASFFFCMSLRWLKYNRSSNRGELINRQKTPKVCLHVRKSTINNRFT